MKKIYAIHLSVFLLFNASGAEGPEVSKLQVLDSIKIKLIFKYQIKAEKESIYAELRDLLSVSTMITKQDVSDGITLRQLEYLQHDFLIFLDQFQTNRMGQEDIYSDETKCHAFELIDRLGKILREEGGG